MKSRKERGKIAQREYRKRHASKFHGLQEENRRLREAIRSISDAVVGHGRPYAELETALSEARDVAGLEPVDFGPSSAPATADTNTYTPNTYTTSFSASSPTGTDPERRSSQSAAQAPGPSRHGTSDPVRLIQPDSPMPYLDNGLTTLSGLISWACTTYVVSLWRTINRGGATTQLEEFVDEHMFSPFQLMTDQAYLASLARGRMTDRPLKGCVFRRLGSLAEVEKLRERYRKITTVSDVQRQQSLKQLGNADMWRTARDIEDHLRRQATPEEYERVQAVVHGRSGDYDVLCVGRCIVSLCGNFVCSPEGPRWHAMYMTMATGLMLRRMRGEAVLDSAG